MIHTDALFDSLISDGSISPALGAIVKDPSNPLCAIARTALLGSLKAKEAAAKLPLAKIVVKNNSLYEVRADGAETFLKALPTYSKVIPSRFKLD